MNRYLVILLYAISNLIYPQTINESKAFSSSQFSLLGGLNFSNNYKILGSFYAEGATNLFTNMYLKLSLGYYKSLSEETYEVNTYKELNIGTDKKFYTVKYNVLNTNYQVIPVSVGLIYFKNIGNFEPYTIVDLSYNLIDPLLTKTREIKVTEYDYLNQIPSEFLKKNNLTNDSVSFALGIGCKYIVNSKLELNLRYLYKFDNEISNTNQILIGITF